MVDLKTFYYFYNMKENLVTIKVYESTRKALKIIAAKEETTQPEILKQLVDAKLSKTETKKIYY